MPRHARRGPSKKPGHARRESPDGDLRVGVGAEERLTMADDADAAHESVSSLASQRRRGTTTTRTDAGLRRSRSPAKLQQQASKKKKKNRPLPPPSQPSPSLMGRPLPRTNASSRSCEDGTGRTDCGNATGEWGTITVGKPIESVVRGSSSPEHARARACLGRLFGFLLAPV